MTISNQIEHMDTLHIIKLIRNANELCNRDADSALQILQYAIQASSAAQYIYGLAYAYNVMGVAYYNKNEPGGAKSSFLTALIYAKQTNGQISIPVIYMNLGNAYVMAQHPDSAFYYYQQSLQLIDGNLRSKSLLIGVYHGISGCLIKQMQFEQAQYYLNKSMDLALDLADSNALAHSYKIAAYIYQNSQPDSALYYYRKALNIYDIRNDKRNRGISYYNMAQMWILKDVVDSAEHYFNLSSQILPAHMKTIMNPNLDIGNVYSRKGEYQKALIAYKKAESDLKSKDSIAPEIFLTIYANLANVYHELNQDALAFQYKSKHFNLRDSLFNLERLDAINRMDARFRLTEKSKNLLSQQLLITKQNAKIQKQYLGIAIAVILILLLLIGLYRRKHRIALIGMNAKLAGVEQERIRLAREMHDGIVSKLTSIKMNFNALPEYQEEYASKQFNETLKHLDDGIAELRRTTHNLHPTLLQRLGLLNALNSYFLQLNASGSIQVLTECVGEFPVLHAHAELHLYRIMQELVQNIIKHAAASEVMIRIDCATDRLNISIRDNGKGLADGNWAEKNTLGLSNLKSRIQLLHGSMKVNNAEERGTVVHLNFHLKYLKEQMYENKDFYS